MTKQRSITEEIAELQQMDAAALASRYEALFGRKPRVKHRQWLFRKCAWKVQEARFGGLSKLARERIDELIAEMDLPLAGKSGEQAQQTLRGSIEHGPLVGTTLVRVWKGGEVRATRVERGWEHDGVVYRSLSAVAKAITGSHCSGRAWFGLKQRTRS